MQFWIHWREQSLAAREGLLLIIEAGNPTTWIHIHSPHAARGREAVHHKEKIHFFLFCFQFNLVPMNFELIGKSVALTGFLRFTSFFLYFSFFLLDSLLPDTTNHPLTTLTDAHASLTQLSMVSKERQEPRWIDIFTIHFISKKIMRQDIHLLSEWRIDLDLIFLSWIFAFPCVLPPSSCWQD